MLELQRMNFIHAEVDDSNNFTAYVAIGNKVIGFVSDTDNGWGELGYDFKHGEEDKFKAEAHLFSKKMVEHIHSVHYNHLLNNYEEPIAFLKYFIRMYNVAHEVKRLKDAGAYKVVVAGAFLTDEEVKERGIEDRYEHTLVVREVPNDRFRLPNEIYEYIKGVDYNPHYNHFVLVTSPQSLSTTFPE